MNPNRGPDGRFRRTTRVERYGVYVLLAAAAVLLLVGCRAGPTVERYQDTYGTVERTTYPDGSVSVRYVR